ncbi:MAG: hypothetical protein WCJ30_29385, partial [Deltaproteobacteria bacterium]
MGVAGEFEEARAELAPGLIADPAGALPIRDAAEGAGEFLVFRQRLDEQVDGCVGGGIGRREPQAGRIRGTGGGAFPTVENLEGEGGALGFSGGIDPRERGRGVGGSIGAAEKYAEELSTIFFAPKLTASRVQFLVGQPLYSGSLRTRLILSGEYGKYLAGLGTLYGLAVLSGAKVSWDTRSNDFGVIRYGQNRINPLSGLGKHAIFAGRLISGEFVGASGKAESIYDDKGRNNWDDITERYVRSTLSPL